MGYRYLLSGSSINFVSTGSQLLSEFQANLTEQFYNSPDAYIISEESPFASGSYIDVEVRINRGINNYTGEKLGDDFKNIIFRDLAHTAPIGTKYSFDNNIWITVNSEIFKNFAAGCTIRRCNNTLRWVDENGVYRLEPCIIEYKVVRPTNSDSDPILAQGLITVYSQLNLNTRQIHENQRFLFGNSDQWNAYKILGGGLRNFLNSNTFDNDSSPLMWFEAEKVGIDHDTDDIVNGIANYYKYSYSLIISPSAISGMVGDTYQLMPEVKLDGNVVQKTMAYKSSSSPIATISASGLVTLVTNGSCIITGCLLTNGSLSSNINVVVSGSVSGSDIRIEPVIENILQGDTQIYTCYLYVNGVPQSDIFIFSASGSVPGKHYVLTTINNNTFSVENIELYLNSPLIINCVSGINMKQININLKGSW